MNSPLISIIVPVYNVEPYLRRCLDSLVNQTLSDIEIVCVDDGSTDASPAILQEYAAQDERIRIITQKNAGLSAARNAGLRVASGEFIAFVDSDDYVAPHTYELALRYMEPGVDYVCFGVQVEGHASQAEMRSHELYFKHPCSGLVGVTDELMLSCDNVVCNKLFRSSIIRERDISFPVGLRYEDNYFFRAYGVWAQSAFYIPEKLYHYVRHGGSIMGETWSGRETRAADLLEIAARLYRYYEQHGLLPERCLYFGRVFFMLLASALGYEKDESRRRALLEQADSFLARMGVDFSADAELCYRRALLAHRILPGSVRKRCWGLMATKYKAHCAKHYFLGIPLFTNHRLSA